MKKLAIILSIICLPVMANAATLGYLGNPIARYWDSTGKIPLTGGKVVTCQPGTVCGCTSFTSKTSYQDSAGLLTNTNPVILDGTATAHIWLSGSYKITVCDRFNVVQFTEDNVSGVVTLATTATTTPNKSEWLDTGLDSIITGLSTTMFSVQGDVRNTFPSQIRIKATVASGISYATVTTSTFDWTGGAHTTIAVVLDSIASPLTGITKVSTGILSPVNTSIPIFTTNNTWTAINNFNSVTTGTINSNTNVITLASSLLSSSTNTWSGVNNFTDISFSGSPVITMMTSSDISFGSRSAFQTNIISPGIIRSMTNAYYVAPPINEYRYTDNGAAQMLYQDFSTNSIRLYSAITNTLGADHVITWDSGFFIPQIGESGTRIIRGTFNDAGVKTIGTEFTVNHDSTGQNTITFSPSFSDVPVVVATMQEVDPATYKATAIEVNSVTKTAATIKTSTTPTGLFNASVSFVAIGPK